MAVGYNKKTTEIKTPAGAAAVASGGATASSSSIKKVQAHFSFGLDGVNNPPATSLRGDPFSVVRTSQGLYTLTLGGSTDLLGKYGVKKIITVQAELQKPAVSVNGSEIGDITDASGTIQIRVVNRSTGAVVDPPAAGAQNRVHVTVTFDNGAF